MIDRGKIRKHIRTNKLKQKEIANALGIAESTLSMMLNGQRKCGLDTYVRLCSLLEVPMNEFITA